MPHMMNYTQIPCFMIRYSMRSAIQCISDWCIFQVDRPLSSFTASLDFDAALVHVPLCPFYLMA